MDMILNIYISGIIVNIVAFFVILIIDRYIKKVKNKYNKNEDRIVMFLMLVTSWLFWLILIIGLIIKKYISRQKLNLQK